MPAWIIRRHSALIAAGRPSTSAARPICGPISITQTVTSSVLGAGATRRLSTVRWGVAGNILTAWVLTIPMAALAAAAAYWAIQHTVPTAILAPPVVHGS